MKKPKQKSIMFVCTGNTCRSPMMEAIFKAFCKQQGVKCKISSSGIYASEGSPISSHSAQVLRQRGTPKRKHKARLLTLDDITTIDLIVTATNAHKNIIGDHKNVLSFAQITALGDLGDPYGGSLDDYIACANLIQNGCQAILERLLGEA